MTTESMKEGEALRVLVACEFSGVVRDAFRARGHDAWSCDLLPTETPGLHYQGDIQDLLEGFAPVNFQADCDPEGDGWCATTDSDPSCCPCFGPTQDGVEYIERNGRLLARPEQRPHWDLMIAHPPCTYLASSGLHWNHRIPGRAKLTDDAVQFVRDLMAAPIERIAIENPIGCLSSRIRKPDQIIQPWMFGHDASKATCLWLKGLPPLRPTNVLPGERTARRANQTASGQNRLAPSPDRWKLRSITYQGIADAMADQWGTT